MQFLSLAQIDTIIEFFTRERDRLTANQRPNISLNSYGMGQTQQQQQALASAAGGATAGSAGGYLSSGPSALAQSLGSDSLIGGGGVAGKNINDLVNNPQVKQALNSLLNLGAIGSNQQQSSSSGPSGHPYGDLGGGSSGNSSAGLNDRQQQQQQQYNSYGGSAVRRHPLTGVEVSRAPAGGQRGYGSVPGSAASRFQ